MRFALLGDHRDGVDLACALAASGRHEVGLYCGAPAGLAYLQRHGVNPRSIGDLEELLAEPELEAVIVAGSAAARPAQLRRALQSECHVLCVHPADPSPDVAYEAAMIQADTGRVLLPMLPAALHPGMVRLAELARAEAARLVELEIWSTEEVLWESASADLKPGLPGWDILRFVGGEIGEIYVQSSHAELAPGEPVLVTGRFVNGTLLHAVYLPNQAEARLRVALVTTTGRVTLDFAHGWPGAARLTLADDAGRAEAWEPFHPWQALIERFEQAVLAAAVRKPEPGRPDDASLTKSPPLLGWHDELRALELDDAARRSAERGRSNTLDLQEATEEASFKGTMTLVGCSLIWLSVIVLIVSVWVPWLIWLIVPVFGAFLVMQTLRWVVPAQPEKAAPVKAEARADEETRSPHQEPDTRIVRK
jgi:predicted dehydrogenase